MCTKVHYHLNVVVPKNDGGCVVPATDLRWLSMKLPPPSDAAIHEDEELTTTLALKFASGGGNGTLEEKNKNIFIFP